MSEPIRGLPMASLILASLALLVMAGHAGSQSAGDAAETIEPGATVGPDGQPDPASTQHDNSSDDPDGETAREVPEEPPGPELGPDASMNPAATSTQRTPGAGFEGENAPGWFWPAALALGIVAVAGGWQARPTGEVADLARASQPARDEASRGRDPVDRPGAEGALVIGQQAVDRGCLEEAIAWFEVATILDPKLALAHHLAGVCLQELDRHEHAAEALRAALSIDPGYGEAAYAAAQSLARLERHREALNLIEPLIHEDPQILEIVEADPAFHALRDHPRYLHLSGRPALGSEAELVWFDET